MKLFRSLAVTTETSMDGSGVKIVFQGNSVVIELTREGDTSLGGKYTNTSGKTFPIKFKKAKLSSEFDGEWEGPGTNNPRNNRDCTNGTYRVTIKDSLITGTFEIPSRVAGVGLREALVTGEVQPDKSAVLEISLSPPKWPPLALPAPSTVINFMAAIRRWVRVAAVST